MTLRVGLIVNPIAGIGGEGAFKGSDKDWKTALEQGYTPHAGERAAQFVELVADDVAWMTIPGAMGVEGLPHVTSMPFVLGETTADNTSWAAKSLASLGLDLLCFVGGDGTAADVACAIGATMPCLGIPAGVKITSPVFAHDVREAAALVNALDPGFPTAARDVTDLDEEAYRAGRVETDLRGALVVPLSPFVQGGKCATAQDTPLEPLVDQVLEDWDKQYVYLVGAGSVCKAIKDRFWGDSTLLGVDAIVGDNVVLTNMDGRAVEAFVAEHDNVRLILSIIGGQGMVLGRGTQMLTPVALRKIGWARIQVVSPPEKLLGLSQLHVDSGDGEFDALAPNHMRVRSGWNEMRMIRVAH
jgi:predicted polyphosphate/ATP-dependent NAD kinase